MRSSDQNSRIANRELQTRGWAAPLPDFTALPRANEANRQRLEWETRGSMNNRHWQQLQERGPTAVSAEMLSRHPTAGANTLMPTAGRLDERPWREEGYHPGIQRPPQSLWSNPYFQGMNVEDSNVVREMRGAVREERRADVYERVAERTFSHQWLPVPIERLQTEKDDYRVDYSHLQGSVNTTR